VFVVVDFNKQKYFNDQKYGKNTLMSYLREGKVSDIGDDYTGQ
jgi:hypothetical protein